MSLTIFKRLFEIRIIQGYYLDYAKVSGVPELPFFALSPTDRLRVLEYEIAHNNYDIRRDFSIKPTAATEKICKWLGMKWTLNQTGLVLGAQVRASGDGYRPAIAIPPTTKWTFELRLKNNEWLNFSNHTLRPTIPSRYYFSNAVESGKTAPVLSLPAPLFKNGKTMEMGRLGQVGTDLFMLTNTSTNAENTAEHLAMGSDFHWANEADRRALPKKFTYRFDPGVQPVSDVKFVLINADNEEVKSVERQFAGLSPASIALDFSKLPSPVSGEPEIKTPDGKYTIKVEVNNTAFEEAEVLLLNDLPEDSQVIGVIEMEFHNVGLFRLINPDGTLNGHKDANGRWVCESSFQVRFLPRYTYKQFRFENNIGNVQIDGAYDIDASNKMVRFKTPTPLLKARQQYKINVSGTGDLNLPNPDTQLKYLPPVGGGTPGLFVSEVMLRSP